jgi:hypothetical protein
VKHDIRVAEVRCLIGRGLSVEQACEIVGIPQHHATPGPGIEWLPLPSEIHERAAEVRKSWSKAEYERRKQGPVDAWSVPVYRDNEAA